MYCKDDDRKGSYEHERFDFLGYTFRPRRSRRKNGKLFVNFLPAVSDDAMKAMSKTIKRWRLHLWSGKTLTDLARATNKHVQGWINYYGRFYPSVLLRFLKTHRPVPDALGHAEVQTTAQTAAERPESSWKA